LPNAIEGRAREAIVKEQLQAEYPNAEVYSQRYIRGANQGRLLDPVTNEGRRFDFVVVEDGQIRDIVEVTSPGEDKTVQFGKTERILRANPGNAFIRVPGTRRLLPIPAGFEQERLERVDLST